jgi:hypothetical protein
MTPTVLTDKGTTDGKTFALINGVRYDVPGYVLPYLNEIEKGTQIEYNENNQILTRIWRRSATPTQTSPNSNGKNNKLIVYQHNFGIVAEVFLDCNALDEMPDFNESLTIIYGKTKEISDQMMRDCGAV